MKEIQLSKGYVALVDDEDFERVAQYKWSASLTKTNVYGIRKIRKEDGNTTSQMLHRFIMGVSDLSKDVDHEDHNGLNCQRYNLRTGSRTQNNGNQLKTRGSSKYKGVSWDKERKLWRSWLRGCLGRFHSEVEAAFAYDRAAREYFGEFALCNFPLPQPETLQLPIAA